MSPISDAPVLPRCLMPQAAPGPRIELDRGRCHRWRVRDAARRAELLDWLARSGLAARVSSEDVLIGNLRVWENILLPLAWRDAPRPAWMEARVRALLARLGWDGARIERFAGRAPDALDAIETRVAGLARALLAEPEILVLDRLAHGLAPVQQRIALDFPAAFLHFFPFRTVVQIESELPAGEADWSEP